MIHFETTIFFQIIILKNIFLKVLNGRKRIILQHSISLKKSASPNPLHAHPQSGTSPMRLASGLKSRIDPLRDKFRGGGLSNPLQSIGQQVESDREIEGLCEGLM
jgi:hypothetical protein